jgi:predicted NBD/HSP70 family sugar kinase
MAVTQARATVRDVRRANRGRLLGELYHGGSLSRQELGVRTDLSQASISNLISEFLDEGLVEEAGLVDSDGGRPRALLRVNPGWGYVVGAEVGETLVGVELYDLTLTRVAGVELPVGPDGPSPEVVLDRLGEGLTAVLAAADVDRAGVVGFGVGVSGVVESGEAVHAQTLGWDAVPFGSMLRRATGLPVHVDNGVKALGRAEMWFGAGRGARHAVVALIGTGVGAAVVTDGHMYRGAHGSAGEWGHTTLVHRGRRCRCGALGCLEAYVGADAVLARWAEAGGPPGADLAALLSAAPADPIAAAVLDDTVDYLGAGLGNLVNLFNPELVVLAGWAGLALGQARLADIRAAAGERALHQSFARTRIELCSLGPEAVARGAAAAPVARLLAAGGVRPGAPAAPPRQSRRSWA